MKYEIKKMGRIVELNDEIVNLYQQVGKIDDSPFIIVIKSKFGHFPTEMEASDLELSKLCNEILMDELEAMTLIPKALKTVIEHETELKEATRTGREMEFIL